MKWDGKIDWLGASTTPCLGMVSLLHAVPKTSFQWVLRKRNTANVWGSIDHEIVPKSHRCTVNWEGSSSEIESVLALKLIQEVNKLHNWLVHVIEIVADDDSTMRAH